MPAELTSPLLNKALNVAQEHSRSGFGQWIMPKAAFGILEFLNSQTFLN